MGIREFWEKIRMIDADGGVMFLTEEDYLDYFDERDTGGQDDETEEDVETE